MIVRLIYWVGGSAKGEWRPTIFFAQDPDDLLTQQQYVERGGWCTRYHEEGEPMPKHPPGTDEWNFSTLTRVYENTHENLRVSLEPVRRAISGWALPQPDEYVLQKLWDGEMAVAALPPFYQMQGELCLRHLRVKASPIIDHQMRTGQDVEAIRRARAREYPEGTREEGVL